MKKTVIEKAKKIIQASLSDQDFDHISLAYFNLNDFSSVESVHFHKGLEGEVQNFYYDLASVTKVLTMGALNLKNPELFKGDRKLLLEHRGGLPRWAILGKKSWKDTVNKFPIIESDVVYSDLSMLRLMLLIEEETGKELKELVNFYWDEGLVFWKDLPVEALCPDTGFRAGEVINGEVNDDNCFKINRFCSHAGLFSTSQGLINSLFNLQRETQLTKKLKGYFDLEGRREFLYGWKTVMDPADSLAGTDAPKMTFGHTGFTGTSVWIDASSGWGWMLLTNSTKKYWFNRKELNKLRFLLGQNLWSNI